MDEAFPEIQSIALFQVSGSCAQDWLHHTYSHPGLVPPIAGLEWRRLTRQSLPSRSGPQDPEHIFEHIARVSPGSTSLAVRDSLFGRHEWPEYGPLVVC